MIFRELDEYVYNYIKNKIENNDKALNQDIFNILKMKHIDGLDNYSREMLSLSLKKRMTITIENYMLKNNDSFFNKENYEDFLFSYVELFIKEFYQPIKKEQFIEINQEYNLRLIEAEYKLANQSIILPNGEVIIVDDIKVAIEKLLESKKIDSYKLKKIKSRIKRVVILSMLISGLIIIALDEKGSDHLELTEVVEDSELNNKETLKK